MDKKSAFIKNMLGFSVVTWVSFLLSFIAAIFATRLFVKEEVGRLNQFTLYAGLFAAFTMFGLDQAFMRFHESPPAMKSRKTLLTFCLTVSLVVTAIVGGGVLILYRWVSIQIIGAYSLSIVVCLVIYTLAATGISYTNLSYRMEKNIKSYAIQGIIYAFFSKFIYLGVAFFDAKASIAILFLSISNILLMLCFIIIRRRSFDRRMTKNVDKLFVKEIARFAVPLIPVTLLSYFNNSVPAIMLRNLMGFGVVGVYTTALQLSNTVGLIQMGFNIYWSPYVYENYQNDDRGGFWKVHKLVCCAMVMAGVAIVLIQPIMFKMVGPAFRGGMLFFPFLLVSPILYTIAETAGMGINISKKTYWSLIIFITTSSINVLLCLLLIPMIGISGAAISAAASAVVSMSIKTAVGGKNYKVLQNYTYILRAVGLLLAMGTVNILLYGHMLWQYTLFVPIAAAGCWLFRKEIGTLWRAGTEMLKSIGKKKVG